MVVMTGVKNQQNGGFNGIYPLVMAMAISYKWLFLWDYIYIL